MESSTASITTQPPYEKNNEINDNEEIVGDRVTINNSPTVDLRVDHLTHLFQHNLNTNMINNENDIKQEDYSHRKGVLNNLYSPINDRFNQENQTLRINKALDWQKKHRNDLVSKARQIALGDLPSDEEEEEEEQGYMDDQQITFQGTKRGRNEEEEEDNVMEDRKLRCLDQPVLKPKKKPYSKFANQVMYSENMEALPQDLLTEWVLMICPIGKRCLVTSGNGQTVARARSGRIINRFQSTLPNGSIARGKGSSSNYCILDCIYDSTTFTFYVLDLMCWDGYAIYDCDTDFRHFWLMNKLNPSNMLPKTNNNHFYQFKPLIPAPTKDLDQILKDPKHYIQQYQSHHLDYTIDGLLFYHRKTQYIVGSTPLVCWLPVEKFNTILTKD